MSVHMIVASIDCDRCGRRFRVYLDPAAAPLPGASLWDLAFAAVAGGVDSDEDRLLSTSVEGVEMLCRDCTSAAAEAARQAAVAG